MLVRTICFCCSIRVDEHIGDDRYRVKCRSYFAEGARAKANSADNNEHYSSTERIARIFHKRIVPCLLLRLLAYCAEHSWSRTVAMLDHTQQYAQYDHRYAQAVPTSAAAGQQGCGAVVSWRYACFVDCNAIVVWALVRAPYNNTNQCTGMYVSLGRHV